MECDVMDFSSTKGRELAVSCTASKSYHEPVMSVSGDAIYRNESVTIRVATKGDASAQLCDMFYSWDPAKDRGDWSLLSAELVNDAFEGVFLTTYATPADTVYFFARVENVSGGNTSETGVAGVNVLNNPPQTNLAITPGAGTVGGELHLSAEESYDVDGNVVSYRWFLNGVELRTDNSHPNLTYHIRAMIEGEIIFTCEATDNEGTANRSEPLAVLIMENDIKAGDIFLTTGGKRKAMGEGMKVHGKVILEGNFTDDLGFDSVEINLSKVGSNYFVNQKLTLGGGEDSGSHISKVYDKNKFTTFWSFELDTREFKNGDYRLEILASNNISLSEASSTITFEIINTPPGEELFLPLLFIGLGPFVIMFLAGFYINLRRKRRVSDVLCNAGNEPGEVFRHIPGVSLASFFVGLALLSVLFVITIIHAESLVAGLSLIFALGISGLFSYLVFYGRSMGISIAGILLSLAGGVLFPIFFRGEIIWGILGLAFYFLIILAEIICHFMFNRHYLFDLQNIIKNKTSVGTNMTFNAFQIDRKYGPVDEKDKRKDEMNIIGKLSHTLFNNREVKIGVFDVEDWGKENKAAGIMLAEFIRLMKKKRDDGASAVAIEITILGSDPVADRKKDVIPAHGFRRTEAKEIERGETYRYEISQGKG